MQTSAPLQIQKVRLEESSRILREYESESRSSFAMFVKKSLGLIRLILVLVVYGI